MKFYFAYFVDFFYKNTKKKHTVLDGKILLNNLKLLTRSGKTTMKKLCGYLNVNHVTFYKRIQTNNILDFELLQIANYFSITKEELLDENLNDKIININVKVLEVKDALLQASHISIPPVGNDTEIFQKLLQSMEEQIKLQKEALKTKDQQIVELKLLLSNCHTPAKD